ncbi:MAG: DUF4011 domain-containing protein [Alphaproteobacteria bacterium]
MQDEYRFATQAQDRHEAARRIREEAERAVGRLEQAVERAKAAVPTQETAVNGARHRIAELEPPPSFEEEEVVSDHTDEAVDRLAEGKQITVLHAPDLMSGADPRDANLHFRTAGGDAALRYAAEALGRNEVHSTVGAEVLEARLIEMLRTARASFEEGGSNSLYRAIGFISWMPQGRDQVGKAPLLLVAVALERRTVVQISTSRVMTTTRGPIQPAGDAAAEFQTGPPRTD